MTLSQEDIQAIATQVAKLTANGKSARSAARNTPPATAGDFDTHAADGLYIVAVKAGYQTKQIQFPRAADTQNSQHFELKRAGSAQLFGDVYIDMRHCTWDVAKPAAAKPVAPPKVAKSK